MTRRWIARTLWGIAGALLLLLLARMLWAPHTLSPAPPVPLQMTAGESTTLVFARASKTPAEAHSSNPAVARLEITAQEDGQVACRLTAVAEGTTEISCTAGADASPTYALSVVAPPAPVLTDGDLVASVSGEKYHTRSCTFAGRIQAENRVFFQTAADAQAQGYTPCAQCLKNSRS